MELQVFRVFVLLLFPSVGTFHLRPGFGERRRAITLARPECFYTRRCSAFKRENNNCKPLKHKFNEKKQNIFNSACFW